MIIASFGWHKDQGLLLSVVEHLLHKASWIPSVGWMNLQIGISLDFCFFLIGYN